MERQSGRPAKLGLAAALLALALPMRGAAGLLPTSAPASHYGVPLPAEALETARALDAAQRALGEEAFDRAQAELARARKSGWVPDHVARLSIRVLLAKKHCSEALESVRAALQRYPESVATGEFAQLQARALAGLGREEEAQEAWLAARTDAPDGLARRRIELEIVRSRQRAGTLDAGADPDRLRALAFSASALSAELPAGHRSPEVALASANALLAEGRSEVAVAAYDEALAGALPEAARRDALSKRAQGLFRLRRYEDAMKAFAEIGDSPEALLGHARSAARAGRRERAVREFEAVAKSAPAEQASHALLLAASLLEGRGPDGGARARALYEQLATYDAFPARSAEALWRLGWSAFRTGDFTHARIRFEQMLGRLDDPLERLRPRYWTARAAAAAGLEARARREYRRIAAAYPLAYYGWRSRRQLGSAPIGVRDSSALDPGEPSLPQRRLQRAALLLRARMPEAARRELEDLARQTHSLHDQLTLGNLLAESGDYYGAQKLVVDRYGAQLLESPVREEETLWWLAWPPAYREAVEGLSGKASESGGERGGAGVEPALVWAIMREESSFRPRVVSSAGARGLLQLMPETARRVARRSGRPPVSADDLFEPETNIALGGAYLRELATRFPGRVAAWIGSYNAGPLAVRRWLGPDAAALPEDVWVEEIPYAQTRAYVKRVLRSLWIYRSFYD